MLVIVTIILLHGDIKNVEESEAGGMLKNKYYIQSVSQDQSMYLLRSTGVIWTKESILKKIKKSKFRARAISCRRLRWNYVPRTERYEKNGAVNVLCVNTSLGVSCLNICKTILVD